MSMSSSSPVRAAAGGTDGDILSQYPGTALTRMENCRERAASLVEEQLSGVWEDVRGLLLWAAGLRDLRDVPPGQGNTGHCFNDFNHVDATTMTLDMSDNENRGQVDGIAYGNQLGNGIKVASETELGPGGSWSTCLLGCNREPPSDVAHLQFKSRIAFKMVWCPPNFDQFVLVDDSGALLNKGKPTGELPYLGERQKNYMAVRGSKYAVAAEAQGSRAA